MTYYHFWFWTEATFLSWHTFTIQLEMSLRTELGPTFNIIDAQKYAKKNRYYDVRKPHLIYRECENFEQIDINLVQNLKSRFSIEKIFL